MVDIIIEIYDINTTYYQILFIQYIFFFQKLEGMFQ